jgi:hypothetical protein
VDEFVSAGRVTVLRDDDLVHKEVEGVLRTQNSFVERIAQTLDALFPATEVTYRGQSPGEVVRQFIVKLDEGDRSRDA